MHSGVWLHFNFNFTWTCLQLDPESRWSCLHQCAVGHRCWSTGLLSCGRRAASSSRFAAGLSHNRRTAPSLIFHKQEVRAHLWKGNTGEVIFGESLNVRRKAVLWHKWKPVLLWCNCMTETSSRNKQNIPWGKKRLCVLGPGTNAPFAASMQKPAESLKGFSSFTSYLITEYGEILCKI